MDIQDRLNQLKKDQRKLERERMQLEEKLEQKKLLDEKLETLYQESGFKSPKALVLALAEKYKLNLSSVSNSFQPRKRTKITKEIRDSVRSSVGAGHSKNAVSKQYKLSYNVVTKIMEGGFDHLEK